MSQITLGGNPVNTMGDLPAVGSKAPDCELVKDDLSRSRLSAFFGSRLVMNIFPSVNTGVCAASVRHFNEAAGSIGDANVLCISRDLPFAQKGFCAAEGLNNVIMLSDFPEGAFGKAYGLVMTDGKFKDLHSRVVIVLDTDGSVLYTEQVPEIGQEPDYDAALAALRD